MMVQVAFLFLGMLPVACCAAAANRVTKIVKDTTRAILLDQEVNGIIEAVDEGSDLFLKYCELKVPMRFLYISMVTPIVYLTNLTIYNLWNLS